MLDLKLNVVNPNHQLVPPTTVFDARTGFWQNRKKFWISLGIKSEVGRGDNALGMSDTCRGGGKKKNFINGVLFSSDSGSDPKFYDKKLAAEAKLGRKLTTAEFQEKYYVHIDEKAALASGTSIFDPVLCEHLFNWFCPKGGQIVDPFAGGSVRGVVAAMCGRKYWGCDLRPEQIKANNEQAKKICPDEMDNLEWVTGDSRETVKNAPEADLIFSCPPYGDLEKYGDDPRDLANMAVDDFDKTHGEIIQKTCDRLKDNRFACWVISEYRGKDGNYAGFVPNTIWWFERAGLRYYNEAILINPMGSLQIRMGKQFDVSRKLGRTHQNIVIFIKGDPKIAAKQLRESEEP
jgi:hypothetical protein